MTSLPVAPSYFEPLLPLAAPLYPKLMVGDAQDPAERAADAFADRVMGGGGAAPAAHTGTTGSGVLRRKCSACEEEDKTLHRKEAAGAGGGGGRWSAPPVVHQALASAGHGLDAGARAQIEARGGVDLSGVRVHTDALAAQSAAAVGARAYTVGRDVVFGAGQYRPGTQDGLRLIAHEVGHLGTGVVRRTPALWQFGQSIQYTTGTQEIPTAIFNKVHKTHEGSPDYWPRFHAWYAHFKAENAGRLTDYGEKGLGPSGVAGQKLTVPVLVPSTTTQPSAIDQGQGFDNSDSYDGQFAVVQFVGGETAYIPNRLALRLNEVPKHRTDQLRVPGESSVNAAVDRSDICSGPFAKSVEQLCMSKSGLKQPPANSLGTPGGGRSPFLGPYPPFGMRPRPTPSDERSARERAQARRQLRLIDERSFDLQPATSGNQSRVVRVKRFGALWELINPQRKAESPDLVERANRDHESLRAKLATLQWEVDFQKRDELNRLNKLHSSMLGAAAEAVTHHAFDINRPEPGFWDECSSQIRKANESLTSVEKREMKDRNYYPILLSLFEAEECIDRTSQTFNRYFGQAIDSGEQADRFIKEAAVVIIVTLATAGTGSGPTLASMSSGAALRHVAVGVAVGGATQATIAAAPSLIESGSLPNIDIILKEAGKGAWTGGTMAVRNQLMSRALAGVARVPLITATGRVIGYGKLAPSIQQGLQQAMADCIGGGAQSALLGERDESAISGCIKQVIAGWASQALMATTQVVVRGAVNRVASSSAFRQMVLASNLQLRRPLAGLRSDRLIPAEIRPAHLELVEPSFASLGEEPGGQLEYKGVPFARLPPSARLTGKPIGPLTKGQWATYKPPTFTISKPSTKAESDPKVNLSAPDSRAGSHSQTWKSEKPIKIDPGKTTGDENATASRPWADATRSNLERTLKASFDPNDHKRIPEVTGRLERTKAGRELGLLLTDPDIQNCEGFKDMVLRAKSQKDHEAILVELEHAKRIMTGKGFAKSGNKIRFEMKSNGTERGDDKHLDADIAIIRPDGSVERVIQVYRTTKGSLAGTLKTGRAKAKEQLAGAPEGAEKEIVIYPQSGTAKDIGAVRSQVAAFEAKLPSHKLTIMFPDGSIYPTE